MGTLSRVCRIHRLAKRAIVLVVALLISPEILAAEPARGPLRRLESNPRYFTDGSGKAIFLAGSHNWHNFQDNGHRLPESQDPPPAFDYDGYLDFLDEAQPQLLPPLALGGPEVDRRAAAGRRQVLPASSLEAHRARAWRPTASRSST